MTPASDGLEYRYNVALAYDICIKTDGDRLAFAFADGARISHRDFDRLANRIAQWLLQRGIKRRDVVAIVHTKSLACYATMLACLKIGAIYSCIDDRNPPARLSHMFETIRPAALVGEYLAAAPAAAAVAFGALCLDLSGDLSSTTVDGPPDTLMSVTSADAAYIMFTSGSTGVPKGAVITHGAIVNFAAWVKSRFAIVPDDVFTNVNPMYFDNSVFDFYGALLNGAALAPVTSDHVADPPALLDDVERAGCTIWFSVPSLLVYLATLKLLVPQRLTAIRSFVFGGEGYPKAELRKLYQTYGERSRLINVYGPTECTCICSAYDVGPRDLEEMTGFVTLGKVAENFSPLVLDSDGIPVRAGGTGELCLLGPQVGLGYYNDPERTARAFTANPLNANWHERMYRTGDLVRVGADGSSFDFVGRSDNQIKHMGHRIEPEEIETALQRIAGVSEAAVVPQPGRRSSLLVAYIVSTQPYGDAELRAQLHRHLPPYMIPQRFVLLTALPKNGNGKTDRHALAQLRDAQEPLGIEPE